MSVEKSGRTLAAFALCLTLAAAVHLTTAQQAAAQYDDGYGEECADCEGCYHDFGHAPWLFGGSAECPLTIRAGALYLKKDCQSARDLIGRRDSPVPGTTQPVIDAEDIDVDFEIGWEASVELQLYDHCSAEVRYFEVLDEMTEGFDLQNAYGWGFATSQGTDFYGLFSNLTQTVGGSFAYETSLRSAEAHWKRKGDWFDLLCGFRYLQLDEFMQLNLANSNSGTTNLVFYDVQNELYGVQIGLDAALFDPQDIFQLDCFGRAGLYYDNITVRNGNTSNLFADSNNQIFDDDISAVCEVGVAGMINWPNGWSLRVGAQWLWINEVALVTDQSYVNGFPNAAGLTAVDTSGTASYVAIFGGLQYVH